MSKHNKLQSECFLWFHNKAYKEQRGLMYSNYNNPPNAITGAQLKACGLKKGVADLTYLSPKGLVYIEIKEEGDKQKPEQKEFEELVVKWGAKYFICRSFIEFKNIVDGLNDQESGN